MKYLKTDASVETYLNQFYTKRISTNKRKIFKKLEQNPLVDIHFLIKKLSLPHQTVSSCISKLMDIGVVEVKGTNTTIGADGPVFSSIYFCQNNITLIQKNVRDRRMLKIKRAVRTLLNYDDILPGHLIDELNLL